MKVRPLHDRVIVKRIEEEETTKGGIIIPDTAKEKPAEGESVLWAMAKYWKMGSGSPLRSRKAIGFFLENMPEPRSRSMVKST